MILQLLQAWAKAKPGGGQHESVDVTEREMDLVVRTEEVEP
jgi:hypothetical protein